MLEAIRDYADRTGRIVGFKAAGGVSTSKAALHRLVLVKETLGDEWLTPERIRIGASSVLNDLLMQYAKTETGRYGRRGLLARNEHRARAPASSGTTPRRRRRPTTSGCADRYGLFIGRRVQRAERTGGMWRHVQPGDGGADRRGRLRPGRRT